MYSRFIKLLAMTILGAGPLFAQDQVESTEVFRKIAVARGEKAPIDKTKLKNLILPAKSHLKVDPAYISRHDVVYRTPNVGPFEGFPMGNGDLGGLIWTNDEGIEIQVNKCDAYKANPADKNAKLMTLGRLNIRFGIPCFSWLDLDDFEGRLDLHKGAVQYKSATKFAKTNVEAITCADRNVWMISCEVETLNSLLDTLSVSVDYERYGSRILGGFKGNMGEAKVGDFGTPEIAVEGKDLVLTESFPDLDYAVAVRVIGADTAARLMNKRRGTIDFTLSPKQKVVVLLSAVTSEEAVNPHDAAIRLLDGITMDSIDTVKTEHARWWNDFWGRSFIHLGGDDYLENIYAVRRYLMAAGSRDNYPIIYHGGIWLWNRDVRNWGALMGWNQLNTYVGLQPQNDLDLLLPHIGLYWRLQDIAKARANELFGLTDSLYMGEPHSVRGWSAYTGTPGEIAGGHKDNFTVIQHIARFFLKQYEFTQDTDFLRDYAYPYARAAGETYVQYLKWNDKNNRYTIWPAKPYECGYAIDMRDTITDLGMIQYLMPRLIEYSKVLNVDADKREKWQHILDNLWDPPVEDIKGVGKVFADAHDEKYQPWPLHTNEARKYHFSAGSALSFPSDVIDMDDKGTELYDITTRFLDLHPSYKTSISMDSIVAARLGNAEKALWLIDNAIKYTQPFPSGMGYNMNWTSVGSDRLSKMKKIWPEEDDAWLANDYVYDLRTLNNSGNRRVATVQVGMESLCIQAAAVNEMLIHSHDGKVRVFPAIPNEWQSAFILRASGGFMVSSAKEKNKEPDHVYVSSTCGKDFKLVLPWAGKKAVVKTADGKPIQFETKGDMIAFKTVAGTDYVITPGNTKIKEWSFACEPNKDAKQRGYNFLGKKRDFNVKKAKTK